MEIKRQAVLIIHGIGEQRPMATLRGFVASVLSEDCSGAGVKYWSKPDRMSESFELRRMTAASSKTRPVTDFYEYYWAYHMRDSKYRHVVQWLVKLLFRNPAEVPSKIRPVWIVSWILVLVILGCGVAGLLPTSGPLLQSKSFLTAVGSFLGLSILNLVALGFIADAARYLNPSAENIAQRHTIRADGIELLRKLHQPGKYDRIILVGHSLGSVIGYDMITHFWTECNKMHSNPLVVEQGALKHLESLVQKGDEGMAVADEQRRLWIEQRTHGNPWLVTDFVTLGSPLVHGQLLLAASKQELRDRQAERELPTSPPALEGRAFSYVLLPPYAVGGQERTIRVLHHAAPFACTRWTNLYFPGDTIGGPLRDVFGRWIRDVRVLLQPTVLSYLPLSHIWYWCSKPRKVLRPRLKMRSAIEELKKALDLDSGGWMPSGGRKATQSTPAMRPNASPSVPANHDQSGEVGL